MRRFCPGPPTAAILGMVLAAGNPGAARGDFILTAYGSGTPVGAWAYSTAQGVGQGNSSSYVPTAAAWAGASFQGYVYSSPAGSWNTIGAGTHDEDTIYVFRTFVLSALDQTVPLRFGGDDGHSLYVDGVLVGGGGFGVPVDFDLHLAAGVPVEIEVGVYNGPGPMGVELQRRGTLLGIESTPGVSIHADGVFQAVPEPPGWAVLGLCLAAWLARSGTVSRDHRAVGAPAAV